MHEISVFLPQHRLNLLILTHLKPLM